ncbi:helix-turn-helix transcriptional regulator [Solilutibacter silvestris]|uniref:HTH domain-containing protein n=1 Tax=Solilutibacter silvestris TaxID=1645665 RepID=A0A2K1PY63_9GAMM|nr:YafY family protein [Lysobacter silvestris]PNS07734.1 HTH domain-containing protein [Lysobacter silvestris]
MTRASRLLRLLDLLRSRRRPLTGARLSERLGVSLRTVYRDIALLREQGADIEGDPGTGYMLRHGYLLPSLMFDRDELEALTLGARWVSLQADRELAQAANDALQRLASVLPDALRLEIETSGLLVPNHRQQVPDEPWLPTLRRAIRDEHVVAMHYVDLHGNSSERRVWPFAMAFFSHVRLMAAWCELRQDFRHFRADRVLSLVDSGQRYGVRRPTLMRRWRDQNAYGSRE